MPQQSGSHRLQREVWFDGRQVSLDRQDLWGIVNNSPIQLVVIQAAQRRDGRFPLKTRLITEVTSVEDLTHVPAGEIIMSGDRRILDGAAAQGYRTCLAFTVAGAEALERSVQHCADYDFAVVDFDLPTNIPLELMLARLQGQKTRLLKRETSFALSEVSFGVLERGSDGVLLATEDPAEILAAGAYLARRDVRPIELQPLVVKEVRHVGMGARSCIDTAGLMTTDEGMIVGSTSQGGVLICSETHYLPYMNLRPFRVNAGAVHSYIWMPDGVTGYLSELKAGSRVLCANTRGDTRELTVGRNKIEVRPLLLIVGEIEGREINVIVQDDWHIRVMGADGRPRNATAVRPGDELLGHGCEPGRHVGIKIDETVIEQ